MGPVNGRSRFASDCSGSCDKSVRMSAGSLICGLLKFVKLLKDQKKLFAKLTPADARTLAPASRLTALSHIAAQSIY